MKYKEVDENTVFIDVSGKNALAVQAMAERIAQSFESEPIKSITYTPSEKVKHPDGPKTEITLYDYLVSQRPEVLKNVDLVVVVQDALINVAVIKPSE